MQIRRLGLRCRGVSDPKAVHKRFLDYRETHVYFGRKMKLLDLATFTALDAEHRALTEKGASRDDEEEARFEEVSNLLHRD